MHARRSRIALALTFAASLLAFAPSPGEPAGEPVLNILYPKHQSAVGRRINVVLDPATDWSSVPFFQVAVGRTDYPVVDTSSGRHAQQGVALARGLNSVTVRALALPQGNAAPGGGGNGLRSTRQGTYRVLATRTFSVYNREGNFAVPQNTVLPSFFHTPENESACSGCHRLDAEPADRDPQKPEQMLCYACHRDIPAGKHIHGPAAVWNCLGCHDPGLAPVKYQFSAVTHNGKRQAAPKSASPAAPTVPDACGQCHGSMLTGRYKHGPAEAGYCTLCHDPHASNFKSWTRRQSWRLCTTCHDEKRKEVHVIKGIARSVSHPTRNRRDPSRPGKRLSCVSCHNPHSSETPALLAYDVRHTFDLCDVCHPKK